MPNPLRQDPTRTTGLRRSYMAEMKRRFDKVRSAIWQLIVTEDAFGLRERTPIQFNDTVTTNNRFRFLTDDQKLIQFRQWLQTQIALEILSIPVGGDVTEPWNSTYISSAYKTGAIRAFIDSKRRDFSKSLDFFEGTKAEFLRQAFDSPEALAKVRLLATRAFEQLRGVTGTMAQQMNTILADGIAHGRGPREIARQMSKQIGALTRARALTIARTEIVHAHAEGQLDSFERLGVEEVGAMVEWKTAGDDRVCHLCAHLEGQRFTIDEARGMLPRHPNCRCAWIPYSPAFEAAEQTG